jgi:exodeoxyribonuclease-3
MTFKIVSWNVNSLRVRLPHVLEWMQKNQPDIVAIQETKLPDDLFPIEEIRALGYECEFSGQRTYNGMAILSRSAGTDKIIDLPNWIDPQRRVLGLVYQDIRIMNLYVPNGESISSEKYQYKLNWLKQLTHFLQEEQQRHPNMILLGDFNIAPEDRDVHDPVAWQGRVLCSDKERTALQEIVTLGFQDCFRLFEQSEKSFSWWDYRLNAFKRNMGLRIDHILASPSLIKHCKRCYIDKDPRALERPSDHAPVVAEFDFSGKLH